MLVTYESIVVNIIFVFSIERRHLVRSCVKLIWGWYAKNIIYLIATHQVFGLHWIVDKALSWWVWKNHGYSQAILLQGLLFSVKHHRLSGHYMCQIHYWVSWQPIKSKQSMIRKVERICSISKRPFWLSLPIGNP